MRYMPVGNRQANRELSRIAKFLARNATEAKFLARNAMERERTIKESCVRDIPLRYMSPSSSTTFGTYPQVLAQLLVHVGVDPQVVAQLTVHAHELGSTEFN